MNLYTDINPYCCAVLASRVRHGDLPAGEVWCRDVATLTAEELGQFRQVHLFAGIGASPLGLAWAGWPDHLRVVTGGFPCQDISSAGKAAGLDGKRSGLYREMLRVLDIVRPDWVLAENVGALSARGLHRLAREMGAGGYRPHCLRVGAWAVGSPQERERWWIVCRREGAAAGGRGDDRGGVEHVPGGGAVRLPAGSGRPGEAATDAVGRGAGGGVADDAGERWGSHRDVAYDKHERASAENDGCADCGGEQLVGPECPRLEGHGRDAGRAEVAEPGHAGESGRDPGRWVHPLWVNAETNEPVPTPQHEWEPPRQYPGTRTINARWRLGLMGFPLDWLDVDADAMARFCADMPLRHLHKKLNKLGIEATGNAQVPQNVAVVARAMLAAESGVSA